MVGDGKVMGSDRLGHQFKVFYRGRAGKKAIGAGLLDDEHARSNCSGTRALRQVVTTRAEAIRQQSERRVAALGGCFVDVVRSLSFVEAMEVPRAMSERRRLCGW